MYRILPPFSGDDGVRPESEEILSTRCRNYKDFPFADSGGGGEGPRDVPDNGDSSSSLPSSFSSKCSSSASSTSFPSAASSAAASVSEAAFPPSSSLSSSPEVVYRVRHADVVDLLERADASDYVFNFVVNDVDFQTQTELKDELGVLQLGSRKRILTEISKMKGAD
uniref:SAM domain-containing protein n=1 Tax=Chromera velia CCMP2878 TaxID=1169474 RepID=A0A0G4HCR5_9ALVE|eukprot:Cvel_26133.t1-p1 / transcript=Cvel_26133.t1 / gene=Cvel_26133 / organism=Chromera_velia_CCMP2878 / gene_product=hypothetical protein / transcript_product=hypothetical protein / location=Cvel_scaffold3060:7913-8410(+) / protein_length=166 / sequence_SO=supercontig / SO=protein_coding / is_pseudo=false